MQGISRRPNLEDGDIMAGKEFLKLTQEKPDASAGQFRFLTGETIQEGIRVLQSKDFTGLGFKKRTITILTENSDHFSDILDKITDKRYGSMKTEEKGQVIFVLLKQVSGRKYVQKQDNETERIEQLKEYRELTALAGRKQDKSLNTLVKMGADKDLIIKDAKKAGFSEFVVDNFRNITSEAIAIKQQEKMAVIENARLGAEQLISTEKVLSWEEEEEGIDRFTTELHDKKRKRGV